LFQTLRSLADSMVQASTKVAGVPIHQPKSGRYLHQRASCLPEPKIADLLPDIHCCVTLRLHGLALDNTHLLLLCNSRNKLTWTFEHHIFQVMIRADLSTGYIYRSLLTGRHHFTLSSNPTSQHVFCSRAASGKRTLSVGGSVSSGKIVSTIDVAVTM
jgi:hypothetical protein